MMTAITSISGQTEASQLTCSIHLLLQSDKMELVVCIAHVADSLICGLKSAAISAF